MKRKRGSLKINIPLSKISLVVAFLSTVAGALFSTKVLTDVNKNIAASKEAARPANVKLIKIITSRCQDCFNVETAVTDFKKLNVNIEEEKTYDFDSPEASASITEVVNLFIKQLAIKRIPTYIVTGEVTKNNLENFIKSNGEIKENTFIFTKVAPIFIDTETKNQVGKVTATILSDPSCSTCIDPKLTIDAYKKAGVKITDQNEVVWNSPEGQKIIDQYKITKLPTFILSPDIDFYDNVKSNWANIGTVEKDKTYVARTLFLPYRDLGKGQIVGLVDLIYLTDSSCADCYKVQDVQKPILTKGYGVAIRSERTIDVASLEGKNLVAQYNITKVPTILLSPEAEQYPNIKSVWKSVGIVGSDGWYIFTGLNQLGSIIYKDLSNNQVIRPAQKS